MRYFASMVMLTSLTAALMMTAAPAAQGIGASQSPALRYEGGASVSVTVSARIVRHSTRIGASLGPPVPGMVARPTFVSAVDGRAVPALVYDYE